MPQGEEGCAAPPGAGSFLFFLSQGLRPGLRYVAPPALWSERGKEKTRTLNGAGCGTQECKTNTQRRRVGHPVKTGPHRMRSLLGGQAG